MLYVIILTGDPGLQRYCQTRVARAASFESGEGGAGSS